MSLPRGQTTALAGAIAVAVGLGSWWLLAREGPPDEGGPIAPTPVAVPLAAPSPVTAPPPTPASANLSAKPIRMPDGTLVAPLNGVLEARNPDWPIEIPYAPIVRTETDAFGEQWYIHADGSKTTTVMRWRQDLGRLDAMTLVENPKPAVSIPAGELPTGRGK